MIKFEAVRYNHESDNCRDACGISEEAGKEIKELGNNLFSNLIITRVISVQFEHLLEFLESGEHPRITAFMLEKIITAMTEMSPQIKKIASLAVMLAPPMLSRKGFNHNEDSFAKAINLTHEEAENETKMFTAYVERIRGLPEDFVKSQVVEILESLISDMAFTDREKALFSLHLIEEAGELNEDRAEKEYEAKTFTSTATCILCEKPVPVAKSENWPVVVCDSCRKGGNA